MKTLFRNGSIHTMNGTEVVHSLLVEDGRILDVNCDVPAGECQVVDLHGEDRAARLPRQPRALPLLCHG